MSKLYKYEMNDGTVVRVRLSTAVKAVAGDEPAGSSLGLVIRACHSTNRRSQLRARGVRLRRVLGTIGTAPNQVEVFEYANITCLTQARQTEAIGSATISYGGQTWTPVATIAEG